MSKPLDLQVLSPLATRRTGLSTMPRKYISSSPKDLLQPSPVGRVLCSLPISLISSSCGTSPPGEHPASLTVSERPWAQRRVHSKNLLVNDAPLSHVSQQPSCPNTSFQLPPENTVFSLLSVKIKPLLTPSRGKASHTTGTIHACIYLQPPTTGTCTTHPANLFLTSLGTRFTKTSPDLSGASVKKGIGVWFQSACLLQNVASDSQVNVANFMQFS